LFLIAGANNERRACLQSTEIPVMVNFLLQGISLLKHNSSVKILILSLCLDK